MIRMPLNFDTASIPWQMMPIDHCDESRKQLIVMNTETERREKRELYWGLEDLGF